MDGITELFFFKFKALFNYRFNLDGVFYTVMSTKPALPSNRLYTAKFIEKQSNFIEAEILNGRKQNVLIEVK